MSEKFKKLTLEVVGFDEDDLRRFPAAHQGTVRHGAGHRADGQRKNDDLLRPPSTRFRTDEDKISPLKDPVEYQLRGITQIPVTRRRFDLRPRSAIHLASRSGQDHGRRNSRQ